MKRFFIPLCSLMLFACSSEKGAEQEQIDTDAQGDLAFEQVDSDDSDEDAVETTMALEEEDVQPDDCVVDLRAYLNDPDTEGKTNIRKSPGGEVIMQIGGDVMDDYFLNLVGQKDGWFKLENEIGGIDVDYDIPGGVGWIHGSVCQVDTRNYGGQELSLYSEPNEFSEKVVSFSNEEGFHIRKVCHEWVKVYGTIDGKKVEGWILAEWLCGNPLTTCS